MPKGKVTKFEKLDDYLWESYKLDICEGNTEQAFRGAIQEAKEIVVKEIEGLFRKCRCR